MYSLYRAWLMRDAVTAASWTTPPDLVITVGNSGTEPAQDARNYGYQFMAHKQLVSMHSGYLKSLIQNESQSGCGMSVTNVSLPNVSFESFAPLLSYMYTGYLDLTNENIYPVLLATHLLHMPRALDLCRAYLVQRQSSDVRIGDAEFWPPQSNPKIVKPIPNRKVHNFNRSAPVWSPVNLSPFMLTRRPEGPFRCVSPPAEKRAVSTGSSCGVTEPKSPPPAVPSTSKAEESRVSPPARTPESIKAHSKRKLITAKRRDNSVKTGKRINNENSKAEYDVACCDGPIRFHRVLNESYGKTEDEEVSETGNGQGKAATDEELEKEYLENYPKAQFFKLKSSNLSNFMHQQMINSNSIKKPKKTKGVIEMRRFVEKEIPTESVSQENRDGTGGTTIKEDNPDRVFACVHCKHTFKSRYCYQKHAKRHLNSVGETEEAEEAKGEGVAMHRQALSDPTTEDQWKSGNVRREVRLLDMNVQYYPCKTCGSKFPSYYFVHKHRKLCHGNEEDGNARTGIPSMENSPPGNSPEKISTS